MLGNLEDGLARLRKRAENADPEVVCAKSDIASRIRMEIQSGKAVALQSAASMREDAGIISEILDQSLEYATKVDSRDPLRLALDKKILTSGEMRVRAEREASNATEKGIARKGPAASEERNSHCTWWPGGSAMDGNKQVEYLGRLGQGTLRNPFSVAVSTSGSLVVTDRPLNRVIKFGMDGELREQSDELKEPMGLFCQGSDIWACDKINKRLVMFDEDLRIVREIRLDRVLGEGFPFQMPAYGCYGAGRLFVVVTDQAAVNRQVVSFDPDDPQSTWSLLATDGFPPYRVKFMDGQLFASRLAPSMVFSFDGKTGKFLPWIGLDLSGYMYDFTLFGEDVVMTMDKYLYLVFGDGSNLAVNVAGFTGGLDSRVAGVTTVRQGKDTILLATDLYQGCVHKILISKD